MAAATANTLNSTRNFRVLADSTAHTTLQKTILKALPKAPGRRAKSDASNNQDESSDAK